MRDKIILFFFTKEVKLLQKKTSDNYNYVNKPIHNNSHDWFIFPYQNIYAFLPIFGEKKIEVKRNSTRMNQKDKL